VGFQPLCGAVKTQPNSTLSGRLDLIFQLFARLELKNCGSSTIMLSDVVGVGPLCLACEPPSRPLTLAVPEHPEELRQRLIKEFPGERSTRPTPVVNGQSFILAP